MVSTESTLQYKKSSKQLNRPKQERTQKRMEQVIRATEELLLQVGIEKISIPEVAIASEVPRASIYQFFPTKYDLLNYIAISHLNNLIQKLRNEAMRVFLENPNQPIEAYGRLITSAMIKAAAQFLNESKIATLLILSGGATQDNYLEYQVELRKVSFAIRQALLAINVDNYIPRQPDTLTILIELIFTCMKHGYYTENYISEAICQEGYRAGIAYLTALKNNSFIMKDANVKADDET
ncbi:TetR/AcrR family transcriptional regulator [Acinetobacter shaoyimingii]|uniref:TetR/AcrR family transcriptional regulator n=2 Tax=Acinetobacter shaoyimingii TaxID=2715164 RepID=A0A6G8S033_9GAMM|nr:TetR/AcrR family transcriptional regulator [Acinetobacter shaoyimingii]QIO07549.1 TetR/AcrR family transcriptional regulator [Acinetobacter shaoyimingii]